MAEITAALVKELRETSGAGMLDCKKALVETGGDIEAAKDWLRKKGLAAAAKKSSRVASQGLIGVAVSSNGKEAVVVEVNSETDFVARNDKFQATVAQVAQVALTTNGDVEAIKAAKIGGASVEATITDLVATIGENITLRRAQKISVSEGVVASYIHSQVVPNLGGIGVLVGLESTGNKEKLQSLGKQLAMHVAAARPESLDIASLDPKLVERERQVFQEQSRASGKPDNIIEKMVEGRIKKYYGEAVFLEQLFVIDGKTPINEVVKNAEKEVGAPIKVTGFARVQLGEGIEKEESNFAAEVAAVVNG